MSKSLHNDPSRAGQLAARKFLFGDFHRFAVAPVHTRFESLQWFVWDAGKVDPVTGGPAVVRQAASLYEALEGLAERREALKANLAFGFRNFALQLRLAEIRDLIADAEPHR